MQIKLTNIFILFTIFIMSSTLVVAITSGNLQGEGDIIINNFGNITVVNDSVWEQNNTIVVLRVPATQFTVDSIFSNFTGNLSVNSMNVRSLESYCFDNCKFRISAQDFVFLTNGTRRQITSDADLTANHNLSNGIAYLSIVNPSKTPLSKGALVVGNSDNTGFLILKSNSLNVEPSVTEIQNNAGNTEFIQGPMKPDIVAPIKGGEWRFGFYDNFTINENLSDIIFNNKTFTMIINHTTGVTINGDLKYDEIFGEIFFPENGDLNVTINAINTYMNITPLYDGYSSSVTLSSSTFIIKESGTYFGSFTGSMKDGSTSDFGLAIFVNEQEQNRTHSHFTTLTSNRYTNFAGQGTFSVVQGDIINLRVKDEKNPASDADFNNINFIIRRIGK